MQHTIRTATNRDIPAIKEVVFSVLAEYGLQADPDGIDADLDDVEKNYLQPGGLFKVVETPSGEIVGTAGLYPLDVNRVELRKMCLKASVRGQGLRKRLMKRMLAAAHVLGYEELRLETNSAFREEIRFYEEYGFAPVEAEHRSPRWDQAYSLKLPARLPKPSAANPPVGVPRRFGIGTLLVVTTAYALLFGALQTLKMPGRDFAVVVGYVTLIGLGQAILFQGKKPRLASYLVGTIAWFGLDLVAYSQFIKILEIAEILQVLLRPLFEALTVGGLLGYLTGCLIAGVFLVVDRRKGGSRARAA